MPTMNTVLIWYWFESAYSDAFNHVACDLAWAYCFNSTSLSLGLIEQIGVTSTHKSRALARGAAAFSEGGSSASSGDP